MANVFLSLLCALAWSRSWTAASSSERYRLEIPVYREAIPSNWVKSRIDLAKIPPKKPSHPPGMLSKSKPPIFPEVYNEFSDLYIQVTHGTKNPQIAKLRLDGRGYDLWLVDKVTDKDTPRTFDLERDDSQAFANDLSHFTPEYLHMGKNKEQEQTQQAPTCQESPDGKALPQLCVQEQGSASTTQPTEDNVYTGYYQSTEISYQPVPLVLTLGSHHIFFPEGLPVIHKVPSELKETFRFDGVFGLSAATNENSAFRSRFLRNMRLGGPDVYFTLDILDHIPGKSSYTVPYGGEMIPSPMVAPRELLDLSSIDPIGSLVITNHCPPELQGGLALDAGLYSLFTVEIDNLVVQVGSKPVELGKHIVHFDPSARYLYFPERAADLVNNELGATHPDKFYAVQLGTDPAQSQQQKSFSEANPFPALYGFTNKAAKNAPNVSFDLKDLTVRFEPKDYLVSARITQTPNAADAQDNQQHGKVLGMARGLYRKLSQVRKSNRQKSSPAAQSSIDRPEGSTAKVLTYSGFARHNGDQSYTKENVVILGEMFFRQFITGFVHLQDQKKRIILKPKLPAPQSAGHAQQRSSPSPPASKPPTTAEMDRAWVKTVMSWAEKPLPPTPQ